jgi:hypothetical protein
MKCAGVRVQTQSEENWEIAGNEVSIFLFRFELRGRGIDFVLNEEIAADMYQEVDEELKPLVHACCETLLRYQHLRVSNTIMDGNFLKSGEFEVMLSKGLGRDFAEDEKARLFQYAKHIADLLATVMDRRTQELKQGKQPLPSSIAHPPDPRKVKQGLKKLGKAKHHEAQLQWLAEGWPRRPGLRPLRPGPLEVVQSSNGDGARVIMGSPQLILQDDKRPQNLSCTVGRADNTRLPQVPEEAEGPP